MREKIVSFKVHFAVFWPPNTVVSPLVRCKTHLTVLWANCSLSRLVPMQMAPSTNMLSTLNSQFFGHFDALTEIGVHHLRRLFPATTVRFFTRTLGDCTSYSQITSSKNLPKVDSTHCTGVLIIAHFAGA